MEWGQAWLNYQPMEPTEMSGCLEYIYLKNIKPEQEVCVRTIEELTRAAEGLFSITPTVEQTEEEEGRETHGAVHGGICLELVLASALGKEGYQIYERNQVWHICGAEPEAVLYGTFRFLGMLRSGFLKKYMNITEIPKNPLRMLNHWDNMDGSIERGYAGNSFFFEDHEIIINERTKDYARMAASVGINAVVINNVNVKDTATELVNQRFADKVRRLSELFSSYGIKLFLSLNYAMPLENQLETADPLDEQVIGWWQQKMKEVYTAVPKLGGFLVKADSEGRPGPFTYGRTQAEGANLLADAIRPYGGLIIWRCFVYNCQQDWRDYKTDRARAGYDYFSKLDGAFADNVILQIKNGPMDFQVREPVSPLFGALKRTNQMLEVQIAQEYTGQQRHVCYLIPWIKEILDFETHMDLQETSTVADIVSGRTLKNAHGGMAAVANTGNDSNWTGHDLAAANLYGFGRLSFDTDLSAEEIAKEWIYLTFSLSDANKNNKNKERVVKTILMILMNSWPAYEKYTSPLGIGWMVTPDTHYGPSVDGYEYARWGTYHRADHLGIGVDRTPNGTGYSSQYNEPLRSVYADRETCPDELLLFFHHVPYTYVLQSQKTVIQHIYDTHFEGVEEAEAMQQAWLGLEKYIPEDVFERVKIRMEEQIISAREWRDVINSYFYRKSGIEDIQKRTIY